MSLTPSDDWLRRLLDPRAIRRELARRRLLDFTTFVSPWYEPFWHHALLASYLDRFARREIRRLMIFMPPRHGKSELVSRHLPAYLLGRSPDAEIIACSHAASLAGAMNRDVQRIVDSNAYREVFPGLRLPAGAGTDRSWQRNSDTFELVGRRGSYRSAGVGGGIVGHGFDYGIIDDPFKDRQEADSPVVRQSVWEWYASTFYTRRSPDACICLMHQRWNEDDLAGRLLALAAADPAADQWTVLALPALATLDHDGPLATPRLAGAPLWPERFGDDELARTRAASEYEWAALYQQEPAPQGSAEWPAEHFGPHAWFDDWPAHPAVKTVALDPSKGRGARHGDYAAFVLLARDRDGTLYCEAHLSQTHTAEGLAERAVEIQRSFGPDGFGIEVNQFQQLLVTLFLQAARKHDCHLPVYEVDNRVSKEVRIRRLGTYLAQHKLKFRANHPSTRELVRQLRHFPNAEHDDGPDALEMALRVMISLHNARAGKGRRR